MDLIAVVNTPKGWKVEYEDRLKDGITARVKYPAYSSREMGVPTRDFLQAIASFLHFAIAISHLNSQFWLKNGKVVGVRIKEGKTDQLISITVEAEEENPLDVPSFNTLTVTTHFIECWAAKSIIQAYNSGAPSLDASMDKLSQQVEYYLEGERKEEQGVIDFPKNPEEVEAV